MVHHHVMPETGTMGIDGGLELAANLVCFVLLYRRRSDNLNMSSTWVCSRNNLIANGGVLLAAAGNAVWMSRWPDILVGGVIATLFLRAAATVLRQSIGAIRASSAWPRAV